MTGEVLAKLRKYAQHLSNLFHTNCRIVDYQQQCFIGQVFGGGYYFGDNCNNPACSLLATYTYGCSEAYRWGGRYIYYCHEGFVFVASSISDDIGNLAGGLVLGPMIMGSLDDAIADYKNPLNQDKLPGMANFTTREINDIAEIMSAITEYVSGVSHSLMGNVSFKQEDILQAIYAEKRMDGGEPVSYPIEMEKRLKNVISEGDKQGAQALLNDLLAKIFLISNFDMEDSKIRIMELLTVLSRATIDAGADSNEIIWFNTGCVKELQKCKTIDELSIWITEIMHRFINYAFDFSSVKHSDTVYKVIEFIRANYYKKIALDDIAQYVNFSKTYLSRIFKEETGENISMYINKIRIEKAKLLLTDKNISLVDVANMAGFEDQSYFTKVFKAVTGIPPKKYKETRSKF